MPTNPRDVINSRFGIGLALWIGRVMPTKLGKRLARFAADYISAHHNWEMVRAVRANRWVVSGETLKGADLDLAVKQTFRHTASCLFDHYHYMGKPEAMRQMLLIDEWVEAIIRRPKFESRGLVLVGLHLGNFDLVLHVVGHMGLQATLLTLAELPGGYQRQFDLRRQIGLNLVPTSLSTLKSSVEYLRTGGMVITGIDRPEPSMNYKPRFFNRPSALPVHHILLALKAQVPVVVASTLLNEDGKYQLYFSDPINMQVHPDRKQEILINAEAVLQVAEDFILGAPDQWAMTFPVWPEALTAVPG